MLPAEESDSCCSEDKSQSSHGETPSEMHLPRRPSLLSVISSPSCFTEQRSSVHSQASSQASIISDDPSSTGDFDVQVALREICWSCCILLRVACGRLCRRRSRANQVRRPSPSDGSDDDAAIPFGKVSSMASLRNKLGENIIVRGLAEELWRLRRFSLFGLNDHDLDDEAFSLPSAAASSSSLGEHGSEAGSGSDGQLRSPEGSKSPPPIGSGRRNSGRPSLKRLGSSKQTTFLQDLAARHSNQQEMRFQMRDQRIKMSFYDAIEVDTKPGRFLIRALSVGAGILEYFKLFLALWGVFFALCTASYWYALDVPSEIGRKSSRKSAATTFLEVDLAADTVYFFLLFLQLRTTIIDAVTGTEICMGVRILRRSLRAATFWLDVVSCMPLLLIRSLFGLSRPIALLKALRGWRFFSSPSSHEFRSTHSFFVFRMVFAIVMGAHLLGSVWFVFVYEVDDVLEQKMAERGNLIDAYTECEVRHTGSLLRCLWAYASICLHQGVYMILGMDRTAHTEFEHLLLACCTPIGIFVNLYVLGEILMIIQSKRQMRTQRLACKQWNDEAMQAMQLTPSLRTRIEAYFTFQQTHHSGRRFSEFLADLNPQLRFEVSMHLFANFLCRSRLFHNLKPRVLRELVVMLKDVIYEPGDWVVRHGDLGVSMYFVIRGFAVMLHEDAETVLKHLHKSSYFGEVSLLLGTPWTVFVRANTFCMLAVLSKDRFATLFQRWPRDVEVIVKNHSVESRLSRVEVTAAAYRNFGFNVNKANANMNVNKAQEEEASTATLKTLPTTTRRFARRMSHASHSSTGSDGSEHSIGMSHLTGGSPLPSLLGDGVLSSDLKCVKTSSTQT